MSSTRKPSLRANAPHGAGDGQRWRRSPGREGGAPSRRDLLAMRHRLLRATREWFHQHGYLEADTPALVRAPSPEAVFSPIPAGDGWLITSPEFQLKRMLAGGFRRIFRLGPVFRGEETGAHHNPEFTLLEWYRVLEEHPEGAPGTGGAMDTLAMELEGLLGELAPVADAASGLWGARGTAPGTDGRSALGLLSHALRRRPWRRSTVGALFARHLGMDIRGITRAADLASIAREAGVSWAGEGNPGADFTAVFSALWIRIEPLLSPEPLLVTDWPAPTASLARLKPGDPTLAERMELYCGGLELANGFVELTDPAEQRRRFEADLAARRAQGLPPVPLDERFLAALEEGMPPAVGMALGFDRLAMLLTGASHIRDVLPMAWDEV